MDNNKLPQEFTFNDENNKDIEMLNATAEHIFKSSSYKDVASRTDLDSKEIMIISLLNATNQHLKFKSIDKWVMDMLLLRYSKNRKSRGEFTGVVSNLLSRMNDMYSNAMQNLPSFNNFNKRL